MTDSFDQRRRAADAITTIKWHGSWGEAVCPLGHDARVFLDDNPRPNFTCRHERCKDELRAWNQRLIETCGTLNETALTTEEKAERKWLSDLRRIERRTRLYTLPTLLKREPVPVDCWPTMSPVTIPEFGLGQFKALVSGLFMDPNLDDYFKGKLWCGELHESGSFIYAWNFKLPEDWLKVDKVPGDQCCPTVFHNTADICGRKHEHAIRREYMVIESDDIGKEQFGNIIVEVSEKLRLRAIVDTGGKSLHAWFDHPLNRLSEKDYMLARLDADYTARHDELEAFLAQHPVPEGDDFHSRGELGERHSALLARCGAASKARDAYAKRYRKRIFQQAEEFEHVLIGLKCDPNMLNVISTTRLPGCPRFKDGQQIGQQRLLYLDPKFPVII